MITMIQRSVLVAFGLQLGMTLGCAAETTEMPKEDEELCIVEQEDGTHVERPCAESGEGTLHTEDYVPGGCADPNQRCNDIDKP